MDGQASGRPQQGDQRQALRWGQVLVLAAVLALSWLAVAVGSMYALLWLMVSASCPGSAAPSCEKSANLVAYSMIAIMVALGAGGTALAATKRPFGRRLLLALLPLLAVPPLLVTGAALLEAIPGRYPPGP